MNVFGSFRQNRTLDNLGLFEFMVDISDIDVVENKEVIHQKESESLVDI